MLCATGQIIVLVVRHLEIGQRPLSRLMKALELLMDFLDFSPPHRNVFHDQHQSPYSFVATGGFDQLQKERQAELVSMAEKRKVGSIFDDLSLQGNLQVALFFSHTMLHHSTSPWDGKRNPL